MNFGKYILNLLESCQNKLSDIFSGINTKTVDENKREVFLGTMDMYLLVIKSINANSVI